MGLERVSRPGKAVEAAKEGYRHTRRCEAEDQRRARDEPAGAADALIAKPGHAGEMERTERKAGSARK